MASMLYMANIFEKVVDSFDNGSLTKKDFVGHGHQAVFHVFLYTCDEMDIVIPKFVP